MVLCLGISNLHHVKKYIVLTVLFVLPLVVYLFFASGINHFAKLPVVTNTVVDIAAFSGEKFKDNITIGEDSIIAGASKVFNSFPKGSYIGGSPAQDIQAWKRLVASQRLNSKKRKKN